MDIDPVEKGAGDPALVLADLLGRSIPHLRPSRSILPRSAERPVDAKLNTARLSALGWDRYTPFAEMVRRLGR